LRLQNPQSQVCRVSDDQTAESAVWSFNKDTAANNLRLTQLRIPQLRQSTKTPPQTTRNGGFRRCVFVERPDGGIRHLIFFVA
jgi:hypothetical protein